MNIQNMMDVCVFCKLGVLVTFREHGCNLYVISVTVWTYTHIWSVFV